MTQINNLQDQPLISVVIRTQNRPHLLKEALQSVAQQTYPFVEAVVVNDGGQSVKHIIEPFENKISGGLQLIEKPLKEGRSAAANTGIESAKGEWIAFLDDDDTFEPNGLELLAQYIKWDKDIIYGQVNVWQMSVSNEENKLLATMGEYKSEALWLSNQIAICAYICKKENALKIGLFDCEFEYLEDWDFYFRLSQNARIQYIPQVISNYRVWGNGYITTSRFQDSEKIYRQKFFTKYHALYSPEVLMVSSLHNIHTLNNSIEDLHTHYKALLEQQTHEKDIQLQNLLEEYYRKETKLIISQYENCKSQYSRRFHQVLNRLMARIAFDGQEEIIDLNILGLTIPTQIFAARSSTVYSAIPVFENIKSVIPISKGKILRWQLNWQQEVHGHTLALQLGTYCRLNYCNLKLVIIPQDHEGEIIETHIHGKYIEDNEYMAFPLNRPLYTGRYTCELSSPDTDNNQHLLGVWLTTNHQTLGAPVVRNYVYKSLSRNFLKEGLSKLTYLPLISILIPTYNTDEKFLRECLDSVINQVYQNWELCIADDASKHPQVRRILEEYRDYFPNKIKLIFCEENRHISATTNAALEMAKGEFIALLDHDDILTEDALFEAAKLLNQKHEKRVDVIYSDEDKWNDIAGCFDEPFFKPDWSPENLKGQMYIGHLGIYRKTLVEEVGGFRLGLEGSQDWDLALRVTEKAQSICHIPKILYHWRKHIGSTAYCSKQKSYAKLAGLKAVNDALVRENKKGKAQLNEYNDFLLVTYPITDEKPLVSIIIPTRDKAGLLKACLASLLHNTTYHNFEIIIVNNNSTEIKTFELFKEYQQLLKGKLKIVHDNETFNFSRLVNNGVKVSKGEMILLLNNDTEIISPKNWLEEMVGYAQQKEIACVSCKLLYKNKTIQHAGVICGMVEFASHSHAGFSLEEQGYYGRLTIVSNYSAVTAACLMIKRTLWEEEHGFDETLAVAYNDVDFCLRLLSKNYRHVVLPHVLFYHHESKTRGLDDTPEKQQRFMKETNLMKQRWQYIVDHDPYYNPHLTLLAKDFSISPHSPYYCETNEEILP